MKTIKYLALCTLAAFVVAGCTDGYGKYTPGEQDDPDSYGVYIDAPIFPDSAVMLGANSIELAPTNATVLHFMAGRTNTNGQITVPVVITASAIRDETDGTTTTTDITNDDIFTTTEITFENGADTTSFWVSFPNTEIAVTYVYDLKIEDPHYAFKYGVEPTHQTELKVSVIRLLWNLVNTPSGDPGLATYNDCLLAQQFGGTADVISHCRLFERDDKPNMFRLESPYNEAMVDGIFGRGYYEAWECVPDNITVDATDASNVSIAEQPIGVTVNGPDYTAFGMMSIRSSGAGVYDPDAGTITFPKGTMQIGGAGPDLAWSTRLPQSADWVIYFPGFAPEDE